MLISVVDVTRTEEVTCGVLLQKLCHSVFDGGTEAATHPEHRERNLMLSELVRLVDDGALGVLHVRLSAEHLVVEFADQGKQGRFPQRDTIEQPFGHDGEVSLGVLLYLHFLRIEAEASYEVNVGRGEVR